MNLRKSVFFAFALLYTQFAFGYKLEATYATRNPSTGEIIKTVVGTGGLTTYEYEGSSILYLISNYNSGSPSNFKVVCKLININAISPILAMQVSQFLTNIDFTTAGSTVSDIVTFSCINKLIEPVFKNGLLEVTVDLSNTYDYYNFKLKYKKPSPSDYFNGNTNIIEKGLN
jgi:hypothetical protein